MAKEYTKLNTVVDYDQEAAAELAEALNEINQLERRAAQLKDLVNENQELHQFVWRTADGLVTAIHNLDQDHLANILQHLVNQGRSINKALRAEAHKRKLEIPTEPKLINGRRMLDAGDDVNDEDW